MFCFKVAAIFRVRIRISQKSTGSMERLVGTYSVTNLILGSTMSWLLNSDKNNQYMFTFSEYLMLNCIVYHWVSFVASLRYLHINCTIWNEKKQNNSTQLCQRGDLISTPGLGRASTRRHSACKLQDVQSHRFQNALLGSPRDFPFPRNFPYLNPDHSWQKLMGMMRFTKHYQVHRDPASTLIAWVPWTSI